MNSYERIQKAIDYIEKNLTRDINPGQAAREACFSISHFYRMFHALVGHSVNEYIRKRRLSEAARRLVDTDDRLIEICLDYRFEYQESFTRAFKKMYGVTPGVYRKKQQAPEEFPVLDLCARYYLPDRVNLIDPRIKVLKRLKPARIAYYRAEGIEPERKAWLTIYAWTKKNKIAEKLKYFRIFGFDNPSPKPNNPSYGYEFWITVNENIHASGNVKIKDFPGGLYAVTPTTLGTIKEAWRNFVSWQKISRYRQGDHQCLEEHLSPPEKQTEKMQIDLYLPIREPD